MGWPARSRKSKPAAWFSFHVSKRLSGGLVPPVLCRIGQRDRRNTGALQPLFCTVLRRRRWLVLHLLDGCRQPLDDIRGLVMLREIERRKADLILHGQVGAVVEQQLHRRHVIAARG